MVRLTVSSLDLGDHDKDWLIVVSRLLDRSTRAHLASIVRSDLSRNKAEYQELLEYTAQKYGLTAKECFTRLLNDASLGVPLESGGESPLEAQEEK